MTQNALMPGGTGDDGKTSRGSDFAVLARQIRQAGMLDRRRGHYAVRIAVNLIMLALAGTAFVLLGRSWWQVLVAAFLGILFTQFAFVGHDAGHRQIARSGRANDLIGLFHGNVLTGLSYGWWISKHNRHHANPNHEERDPDVASAVIAFSTRQAEGRRGWATRALARNQAYLFFPMLLLEGFNLHVASVRALIGGGVGRSASRWAEALALSAHVAAYLAVLFIVLTPMQALVFLVVHQCVFGFYMGCTFAPNHKGMPMVSEEDQLDFLRRQVLTSRNVRGGRFVDFVLGGLNYQIEHHLFPSMPRPSLRRAQALVRAHCARHGLTYHESSMFGSYAQVLRHLHAVGTPLRQVPDAG
jgi:fatty acid desaturase